MRREQTTIRLPAELKERLKQQLNNRSQQMGISVNSLVIQILWDWVAQQTQSGRHRNKKSKVRFTCGLA